MALTDNAYGSTAKVAEIVPRYAAAAGDFDTTTTPTKAAVENMIDRVSGLVNAYLKAKGFTPPLANTDNVLAMEQIVVDTVATMVEGIRGTGRYSPKNKAVMDRGSWAVLSMDVKSYLDSIVDGLEVEETYARPNNSASRSPIRQDGYSDNYTVVDY